MAAATRARRVDPAARITVLESSTEFSRGTCALPYFVSGEIAERDRLTGISRESLAQAGIDLRLSSPVEAILASPRQVRLRGGALLDFDRLIVAAGSRARVVPTVSLSPSRDPRLWTLRSIADADRILSCLTQLRPSRVAVVGAGYLGLEMAEVLTRRGLKITLFHRQANLMRLCEPCHQTALAELERHGVEVRTGHQVRLLDPACRQRTVEFQEPDGGRRAEGFDAVFLATGSEPDATLLAAAGARLGPHGGALVDSRGETTLGGIYAAGDGVELPSPRGGPSRLVALATSAARLGRVCGENAAGGSLRMTDSQATIAIRLFSLQIASVGHPADWSGAASLTVDIGSSEPDFPRRAPGRATFFSEPGSGRLLGAQFAAPDAAALADLTSLALSQGLTLNRLGELDSCYTPPLNALWHPFYLAARAAGRTERAFQETRP